MSHPVESVALEVMAGKIKQLESDVVRLSSQRDNERMTSLPSLLGDFARVLRSHGIATVFHTGKIDPIGGGTAAESLQAAVEQYGRRESLPPECQAHIIRDVSGSLFDATSGFDAIKKAPVT